jgi:hypothetical protein
MLPPMMKTLSHVQSQNRTKAIKKKLEWWRRD